MRGTKPTSRVDNVPPTRSEAVERNEIVLPQGPSHPPPSRRCPSLRSALPPQHRDELGALALREAADRLARRDPALDQDLVDLHAPVLRDGEEHVEDLRGLDVLGRLEEQVMDARAARLEVALELGAAGADLVCPLEGLHPLDQKALGSRPGGLRRRLRGWRHGGESTSESRLGNPNPRNSSGPQLELQAHGGELTLLARFAGLFQTLCAMASRSGASPPPIIPLFAVISDSSAATRAPASGSRNDSVPTPTTSAPACMRSYA